MKSRIITSQGRVADRTPGAIPGALAVAKALAARYDLSVKTVGTPAPAVSDDWREALPQAHETLKGLAAAVSEELTAGRRPLLATNTCSASLATIPQAASQIDGLTVLWVDAHGDFNTPETTDSGYMGGMALAGICGLWDSGHGGNVAPEKLVIFGARDIDPEEMETLERKKVTVIKPEAANAQSLLAAIGTGPLWIHIDWDVMEPGLIPAAYAIEDGLLAPQLRDALAAIPASQIAAIELAEFELPKDKQAADHALDLILEITAPLYESIGV
ncbi:arginase [Ochrobactrum sp. MYb15]|uniref:arginase family protein n=1 Tax=Brucella pituitosa TaxID=571256 RepID=UPI000CFB79B1|nr:arginase [Ochrobactrum sp. MYb19]PRA68557.1 arginase [Ochrobactrum sp. MYb18]PRA74215.1 arginase [Brucella thiophenivorans]PRA90809.1 arginase [Ochrobactrum sp. MYb14]PRA96260.1 arginase [Ochrobactrum sp. MYb15]